MIRCLFLSKVDQSPEGAGARGYSLTWAIQVCAAPNGMVFQQVWFEIGYGFCTPVFNWTCFQTELLLYHQAIRPFPNVYANQMNLKLEILYSLNIAFKIGLTQGVLWIRSERGYQVFDQVYRENHRFWSEIGQRIQEACPTPPPYFSESISPHRGTKVTNKFALPVLAVKWYSCQK